MKLAQGEFKELNKALKGIDSAVNAMNSSLCQVKNTAIIMK